MSTLPDPASSFRSRGLETTRLDTFVDAAFAFGATVLLISSGDLPADIPELKVLLADIPSYALSFATMMIFWLSHRYWSRLYGLENTLTIGCTLLLVLTLLVYIYPLKLMYGSLIDWLTGRTLPNTLRLRGPADVTLIMGIYGIGFSALSACMLGLYAASLRASETMGLNPYERSFTRVGLAVWSVLLLVGVSSALLALYAPTRFGIWAGMLYALLGPLMPATVAVARKRTTG